MVKINKIYTKTGDDGQTGLVGGDRVDKDAQRVEAYGTVDELNAFVGAARTSAEKERVELLSSKLAKIQNELFDIGSELATPAGKEWAGMIKIGAEHIKRLETWIDELCAGIPELRSFVLPGGSELNSQLHLARAVCRRAERESIRLSKMEGVSKEILVYLNRLSDLFFAMSRYDSAHKGAKEYLWQPGKS